MAVAVPTPLNVIRVMAARARSRVPVFEKVHALMKRIHITCNGKYTENCWAETETSPKELAGLGSVWPIFSLFITEKSLYKALTYLCYSVETSNVEVRQFISNLAFSRHNF